MEASAGQIMKEPRAETPVGDAFAGELARYDRLLEQLAAIADPILIPHSEEDRPGNIPEEAPMHKLHTQVLTLRSYNNRFADLNSRLRP